MSANFGTDGDGWKGMIGADVDLMIGEGMEGCDKQGGDLV